MKMFEKKCVFTHITTNNINTHHFKGMPVHVISKLYRCRFFGKFDLYYYTTQAPYFEGNIILSVEEENKNTSKYVGSIDYELFKANEFFEHEIIMENKIDELRGCI